MKENPYLIETYNLEEGSGNTSDFNPSPSGITDASLWSSFLKKFGVINRKTIPNVNRARRLGYIAKSMENPNNIEGYEKSRTKNKNSIPGMKFEGKSGSDVATMDVYTDYNHYWHGIMPDKEAEAPLVGQHTVRKIGWPKEQPNWDQDVDKTSENPLMDMEKPNIESYHLEEGKKQKDPWAVSWPHGRAYVIIKRGDPDVGGLENMGIYFGAPKL